MSIQPKIVVYGSVNTDMIVETAHLPRPGETVLGGQFRMSGGGKGANQAVAAARAGAAVTFVARVGEDDFGRAALAAFRKDGIDTSRIGVDPAAHSGVALISVAASGENQIAVASGANALLNPEHVQQSAPALDGARMVIAQLETPLETVCAAAQLAAEAGVPFILNPAPARPLPPELLAHTTLLTPNESECELLTGVRVQDEASMREAAGILLKLGVKSVVITLGKRGSFLASGECFKQVPSFSVVAKDTTGAGDVFNGALAVALAEGRPLEEAVTFGNAAAALSVTRAGAQDAAPTRSEIDAFLKTQA